MGKSRAEEEARNGVDADSEKDVGISGSDSDEPGTRHGAENPDRADRMASGVTMTRQSGRQQTSGSGKSKMVGWRDLPRKDQLVVITLARLSEPLVQTSLQVRHGISTEALLVPN
jgi:hypothetical protein